MNKHHHSAFRRLFVALTSCAISTLVFAQGIPEERNINIIGINPVTAVNPVPDIGLKQQNEPACAMKPSNPLHILCAFNDYRGVDNPAIGDAWEGYAYSINGGQTWVSDLLPGHPADLQSLGLDFAADPQVVAAPGLALISYIAADRGEGADGGLFLQHMFEVNREAGAPWVPAAAPIEVASGDADSFIDKPFLLLHPADAGSGTVTVSSTLKDGTPVSQEVPAATIYLAYTTFSGTVEGGDLLSTIQVAISDDYGATWTTTEIANSACQLPGQGHCKDKGKGHDKGKGNGHGKRKDVIQSASLAANGDTVCAVWRRFEDADDPDAIMSACSADGGETFAMPSAISAVPEFFPFDQGTTEATFRTNSYPVITTDGTKFYAFWASRLATSSPFFARIVYSTSVDGSAWTVPLILEDTAIGHQFMPSVATARGTIQLAWYDTRRNLFQADFIQDRPGTGVIPDEDSDKIIRNQADVRTAQIINGIPTPSVQVSRYIEAALQVDGPVEQVEFNFMNDRLFKKGSVPFDGDYPNVAASTFRLDNGQWVSNIPASASLRPVDFLVTWTDNRDVRGNVWEDLVTPTVYTPADQAPMMASNRVENKRQPNELQVAHVQDRMANAIRADAEPDETDNYGTCVPGTNADRSRNQNVYSSVIRPGVSVDSPSASKPTGAIQRAHVVWISNNESTASTYTVTIDNQPPDAGMNGRASFLQVPVAPFNDNTGLLTEITVDIDPNSTVARTVYVTSQFPEPEVDVSVSDGGSIVYGTITLNGDILSPDVQNPDVQNPDVQNPDIQNAEVHNPDVQNPVITTVQNPDVQNPDVQNPDVQNPDVQNPDVQNPDVQNPDIQNPDVQNSSLEGSNTENPDVGNETLTPAEKEEGYTDVTYRVGNDGNTTTAFSLDAFINGNTEGLKTQLIATRTHVTETSRDCVQGKLVQNQVIFNKINPDLSLLSGNSDDGVFGDGSAYIAPGEEILVTLRVWGDPALFDPGQVGLRTLSQSCNSVDKPAGTLDCDPPLDQDNPTSALITFDFIPTPGSDIFINDINTELARFGVQWEEQNGTLRVTNNTGGPFAGIDAPSLAFNTDGAQQFDGTHTARFVCPDDSGRLAEVSSASITVADTEAVPDPRVVATSYDRNGVFLETASLTQLSDVLNFTVGPIARIVFVDSGGDGHLLDNFNYEGSECLPDGTIFTQTVIISDTDILNTGFLVAANDLGINPDGATVNGVVFGSDQSGPAPGEWQVSGDNSFSSDNLSAELDELLDDLIFVDFGRANVDSTFTIGGLIQGRVYRLQLLLSNDFNATGNDIEVTVEGDTYALSDWQPDPINLTAEFTATSGSVTVVITGGSSSDATTGRGILNAYALHDLSPPIIQ